MARSRQCEGWPDGEKGRCLNVLVLQGGGALGAYHLGVVEELATAGLSLDWVAGISIGAINAALIAGNPPGARIPALIRFWERVSGGLTSLFPIPEGPWRDIWSKGAAFWIATQGVPGFFEPRMPPPQFQPEDTLGAVSFYDTAPLRATLDELVNWDQLNDGPIRISVGAVSVTTGRMHFFDNKGGPDRTRLHAGHILASGALPPGFPPVEIDGDWYWDGGVASNAPIQHVLDESVANDKNIFQVDLFPAEGPFPKNLLDAETRAQDIRYSSRTRLGTNLEMSLSPLRMWVQRFLHSGSEMEAALSDEDRAMLREFADEQRIEIAQIIYREKAYSGKARGFEFSRPTMEAHRAAGRRDASRVFCLRDWSHPPQARGVHAIDVGASGDERVAKPLTGR